MVTWRIPHLRRQKQGNSLFHLADRIMQIRISRQPEPVSSTVFLPPLAGVPTRCFFTQPAEAPVSSYLRRTGKDCVCISQSHRGLIDPTQIPLLCHWHHKSPVGHTVPTALYLS